MRKFLLKAFMIAAFFIFMARGGWKIFILGWRFLLPLLVLGLIYLAIRRYTAKFAQKKHTPTAETARLGPIVICPQCNQEIGSCAQCQNPSK